MRETDRSADTKHKYDDILDCPHHVSSVHPPMPMIDRAAQFAPFSALTGYEEIVKEESRLTEQRVEKAKELFATTDLRTHEVAELTGFGDDSYFSKIFRKVSGKNPGSFRKRNIL